MYRKINKQQSVLIRTNVPVSNGMKDSLLDAEERVGEQLLANGARDGRRDALCRGPLQLLCHVSIVGLDMVGKLEVGLGVLVSTVNLSLDGQGGQDVKQAVVHLCRGTLKESPASTYVQEKRRAIIFHG